MLSRPRRHLARHVWVKTPDVTDLHPAEQHVHGSASRCPPQLSCVSLRASIAAEEQEQITNPDALVVQMSGDRAFLPEQRSPPRHSRDRVVVQIRIEMSLGL